jgi:hypothetical protein
VIYPAAVWSPGVNAGYKAGRTSMRTAVCHYTVGRNSAPIGLRGYFQFLVARDGTVTQFAEADAVCWHAGTPWNSRGPGIEVEYLDEPAIFTPEAEAATGLLVSWLHDVYGIRTDFYDGPRIAEWDGFITHRSLIQSGDAHSDYWPHLPIAGDDVALDLTDFAWLQNNVSGQGIDGKTNITNRMVLDAVAALAKKVDEIPPAAVVTGSGLTPDAVRAIVREELNKTKLAG